MPIRAPCQLKRPARKKRERRLSAVMVAGMADAWDIYHVPTGLFRDQNVSETFQVTGG
jgi:hypothetical protein